MEMEKSHKLYQIVRLRQMVMKWRVQAIQRARLMKARSRKLITYHPSKHSASPSSSSSSLSSPPLSSSSRKDKGRKGEGEGEGEGGGGGEGEEEEEEEEKIEGLPPKGFVAVYVGESECGQEELQRFLVQIECLCHPAFQKLLCKAEDEFGFAHHHGGIVIPCNVALFKRILALLQQQQKLNKSIKGHGHSHHHHPTTTKTTSSNNDGDASTSVELEKLVELCLGDQPQPQPQTCGGNGPNQPIASLHDLIH